MKKIIASLLCVVMMMTLLVGCGGTSESEEASGEAATSTAGSDIEGIVRYTLTATPAIDPGVGSDLGASSVLINVYDPLVMPAKDGSVAPCVAESWDTPDEGKTWVFKIREDITFHSGNALTANDVAYTLQRLLDMGEGFGYLFSAVESVTATDDTTLEIVCKSPTGTLLASLVRCYVLDSKLVQENYAEGDYGDNGDYGKAFLLENDAGSGPYKVTEYAANSHVLCELAEGYWGELDANVPKAFKAIGSNEAVTVKTMMKNKELELTDKYQSSETIAALDDIEGIDIQEVNTGDIMYLLLNNAKAPTDDAHIRKALAYMIDYDIVCSDIYPNSKKADSIISKTLLGYKSMGQYEYNIEKAKEEIAQSKYANDIANYPIEVCWVAETPDREKLALLIQAAAAEVGLNIEIVKTPWASVVENSASPDTTAHVTTTGFAADYSEAGGIFDSALHSSKAGTWMNCCWVDDPNLDSMIDEALTTVDTDERAAKYQAIQDYLADECVMIPLCEETLRMAYQSSYVEYNSASQEEVLPVMGYINYMPQIRIYPDQK